MTITPYIGLRNQSNRRIAAVIPWLCTGLSPLCSHDGRETELDGKTIFTGGTSLNKCPAGLLGARLGTEMKLPDSPQLVGALGAGLNQKEEPRHKINNEVVD